jgi:hypothetical protein
MLLTTQKKTTQDLRTHLKAAINKTKKYVKLWNKFILSAQKSSYETD